LVQEAQPNSELDALYKKRRELQAEANAPAPASTASQGGDGASSAAPSSSSAGQTGDQYRADLAALSGELQGIQTQALSEEERIATEYKQRLIEIQNSPYTETQKQELIAALNDVMAAKYDALGQAQAAEQAQARDAQEQAAWEEYNAKYTAAQQWLAEQGNWQSEEERQYREHKERLTQIERDGLASTEQIARQRKLLAADEVAMQARKVGAYGGAAKAAAQLLGAGVREMAAIMIPFEIAEGTKEMARFLGTGDPAALASALQHGLAIKQYLEAAKGGASGGSVSGGGGGGGGGGRHDSVREAESSGGSRQLFIQIEHLPTTDPAARYTVDEVNSILDRINEGIQEGSTAGGQT
jgi:hypothetical protein